jgi:hypothetical protein
MLATIYIALKESFPLRESLGDWYRVFLSIQLSIPSGEHRFCTDICGTLPTLNFVNLPHLIISSSKDTSSYLTVDFLLEVTKTYFFNLVGI